MRRPRCRSLRRPAAPVVVLAAAAGWAGEGGVMVVNGGQGTGSIAPDDSGVGVGISLVFGGRRDTAFVLPPRLDRCQSVGGGSGSDSGVGVAAGVVTARRARRRTEALPASARCVLVPVAAWGSMSPSHAWPTLTSSYTSLVSTGGRRISRRGLAVPSMARSAGPRKSSRSPGFMASVAFSGSEFGRERLGERSTTRRRGERRLGRLRVSSAAGAGEAFLSGAGNRDTMEALASPPPSDAQSGNAGEVAGAGGAVSGGVVSASLGESIASAGLGEAEAISMSSRPIAEQEDVSDAGVRADGVWSYGRRRREPRGARNRRDLRRTFSEALENGRGGAALGALRQLLNAGEPVTERAYSAAMFSCMRQGAWTSGLEVFRLLLEQLRSTGRSPSQVTWKSLAKGLRYAGQAEQGVAVLWQALEGGVTGIDEEVCAVLLDTCALKGRMGLAEEITYLMDAHHIEQGPMTFCILLKGYGRQRRVTKVVDVMKTMRSRGVVPDVVALNSAVDAFVRCGELPTARKILESMENAPGGSTADAWTYNTIIKGLGREQRIEEAFDVVRGMVQRGCWPDEVTTNSLVDICVRCGDLDRAYGLLKNPSLRNLAGPNFSSPSKSPTQSGPASSTDMAERDGLPTPAQGGGRSENQRMFREAFPRFDVSGVEVVGNAQSSAEEAKGLPVDGPLAEVGDAKGGSDSSANFVLNVNVDNGGMYRGPNEAVVDRGGLRVTKGDGEGDVREDAGFPSTVGRSTAGYDEGKQGRRRGRGASDAFDSWEAQEKVVRPSVGAFTSILAGFAAAGDKDRALGVVQQMVEAGVEPNDITYSTLISACLNAGDMDGARRLFAVLEERSVVNPSTGLGVSTYNTIISGLCRMHAEPDPAAVDPVVDTIIRTIRPEADDGGGDAERWEASRAGGAPGARAEIDREELAGEPGAENHDGSGDQGGNDPCAVREGPELLSGGSPDGPVANALPEGIKEALKVLLSMRRRGVHADEVTMNSILDGLVKCYPPRVREAEAILTLMSGWGIRPNQVSFSVMLCGYGREGDLGGSEVMFDLMSNDLDRRPDVVALNSLLDACVRNGDVRRAVQILEQAVDTALSGKAVSVASHDWVSSTGRACWGEGAGDGAVALRAAVETEEWCGRSGRGRGQGRGRRRRNGVGGQDRDGEGCGEETGHEKQGGRPQGIFIDVHPNQVSFATVVMGLVKRGDALAGRKAISLYERMRREFQFVPDEADSKSEAETALETGRRALQELRELGWEEEVVRTKEQMLERMVSTGPGKPRSANARKRKVSAEIFEKYGWNKMESHFPIL